jgi:hypothetical protein
MSPESCSPGTAYLNKCKLIQAANKHKQEELALHLWSATAPPPNQSSKNKRGEGFKKASALLRTSYARKAKQVALGRLGDAMGSRSNEKERPSKFA